MLPSSPSSLVVDAQGGGKSDASSGRVAVGSMGWHLQQAEALQQQLDSEAQTRKRLRTDEWVSTQLKEMYT